jgi:hypothetical protein
MTPLINIVHGPLITEDSIIESFRSGVVPRIGDNIRIKSFGLTAMPVKDVVIDYRFEETQSITNIFIFI